ncbi:methyltransferase [Erythrobacter sp. YJ-T3-07]|uniref:methyltransferase n=1 Tax=Erythrobacter sp. YJ-T3-07 TaxID=2793063 RepID=UPI0034D30C62
MGGLVVPENLKGRLRFGAYDFFREQDVVVGADVYLFRNCFHNWSANYAVRMLRNQIPALKKGARVFVNEACMPEPASVGLAKGKIAWSVSCPVFA